MLDPVVSSELINMTLHGHQQNTINDMLLPELLMRSWTCLHDGVGTLVGICCMYRCTG